jgi:hypothetical protein
VLVHFPVSVCLNVLRLSLDDLRREIDGFVNTCRARVRAEIATTLSTEMARLPDEYTALSKRLRSSVTSLTQQDALQQIIAVVPQARARLDESGHRAGRPYELLYSLYFGLDRNVLVQHVNCEMLPLRVDIGLEKALALLQPTDTLFRKQIPSVNQELRADSETIARTISRQTHMNTQRHNREYRTHLLAKIE